MAVNNPAGDESLRVFLIMMDDMLTKEREQQLQILLEKTAGTDDSYYVEISEEMFLKASKRWPEEDIEEMHCIREIGLPAYAQECVSLIAALDDSEDLHWLKKNHNYDDGMWLPTRVIEHPACDMATALLVYYAIDPAYIYDRYATLEEGLEDDDYLLVDSIRLMQLIEAKALSNGFLRRLSPPDLSDFIDEGADFSCVPLTRIPDVLLPPGSTGQA